MINVWREILKRFCEDSEYRKYFCEDLYEHRWDWLNRPSTMPLVVGMSLGFAVLDLLKAILYILLGNFAMAVVRTGLACLFGFVAAQMVGLSEMIESADRYARRRTGWR